MKQSIDNAQAARRDEIVEAAVPVFLRYGYKKTSMDAVAEATGLSRQALYIYFPSKTAVFAAVVESLCQTTQQATHEALWRQGLDLDSQLLAAFVEVMPQDSLSLMAELLENARAVAPESVSDIDAQIVQEIAARLTEAGGPWATDDVLAMQAAQVLQAASYGFKEQTSNHDAYLSGMYSAIKFVLGTATLTLSTNQTSQNRRIK